MRSLVCPKLTCGFSTPTSPTFQDVPPLTKCGILVLLVVWKVLRGATLMKFLMQITHLAKPLLTLSSTTPKTSCAIPAKISAKQMRVCQMITRARLTADVMLKLNVKNPSSGLWRRAVPTLNPSPSTASRSPKSKWLPDSGIASVPSSSPPTRSLLNPLFGAVTLNSSPRMVATFPSLLETLSRATCSVAPVPISSSDAWNRESTPLNQSPRSH
mmetsp:Transcript_37670/g.82088  ORF Transcript_37670/g.82088 Transcript_37670/m.82088 type:complete len:214 (-) Transcript_37670:806-1447(-)